MTVVIEWKIDSLDCIPDVAGETDYVVTSHWRCNGTDGIYSGSVYSTVTFPVDPSKANYIPYADLTEADVIAWTQNALGSETVAATEQAVTQQIENQINPPIITPPLPWSKTAGKAPETVDPKPVV